MMRTKLAALAAISAAGLAIGLTATPAQAATVGTAYLNDTGTGTGVPFDDTVLNTCLPIGISAQSGRNSVNTTPDTLITVYNGIGCQNQVAQLTEGEFEDWNGAALFYIVTRA